MIMSQGSVLVSAAARRCSETADTPDGQLLKTLEPFTKRAGITRVGVVTGLDVVGLPVVMVVRPQSRSLSVTQGKGLTQDRAKLSGVMEALEQFHAETPHLPLRYSSHAELSESGRRPVELGRLPRSTLPCTQRTPLLWAEAAHLGDQSAWWVPFELVHLDYRVPLPAGSGYFCASSTGLGAGVSLADAELHALCEVVERHETLQFLRMSPGAQARRRVDLGSLPEGPCRALVARLERAGVQAAIWDLTSALQVACFFCELRDRERDPLRILGAARGFGCHPSAERACVQAICEAAQSRLTVIAGVRDDITRAEVTASRSAQAHERSRAHHEGTRPATRSFGEVASRDLLPQAGRDWLVRRLICEGHGPPLRVDLSKPGWPAHVVRVVVPGLRLSHVRHVRSADDTRGGRS